MKQLLPGLYLYRDTCNVYLLADGCRGVLIDTGSAAILDELDGVGVREITHALYTHYHRDQCQGSARLPAYAQRLVPEGERQLFEDVETFWRVRQIYNNYDNTFDRYCLFHSVPVAGVLRDDETVVCGGRALRVVPAPGHTAGSVALVTEVEGVRVAFVGDLLYAAGKLWNLACTQWSYNGHQGLQFTLWSLRRLRAESPDLLCPSHGSVIGDVAACLALLEERIWRLAEVRGCAAAMRRELDEPIVQVRPRLFWNWASQSHNYIVLSNTGKALQIDAGYHVPMLGPSYRRHQYRPVDNITPWLRAAHGIDRVDTLLLTHVHDDHIALAPYMRRVHGTQIWGSEIYQDILARPARYDLPCLWYEPIPLDRVIASDEWFVWEDVPFRLHPQPGHVLYAVTIEFELDGVRVLAVGDQQGNEALLWNYVYRNRFRHTDYIDSARHYADRRPDLIISGHWPPLEVTEEYLAGLADAGEALADAHAALLPLDDYDIGAEAQAAFLRPYQSTLAAGETVVYDAEVKNPYRREVRCRLRLVAPPEWNSDTDTPEVAIAPGGSAMARFRLTARASAPVVRERIGLEVSFDGGPWDCVAEALVNVDAPISW